MRNVLVTGGNGQLANNIKDLITKYPNHHYIFKSSLELDVLDIYQLDSLFRDYKFKYCINCAAYTAVDKAENDQRAFEINENGVTNLSKLCKKYDVVLIHFSTDFVFDGLQSNPYKEMDSTNPINQYGLSKLKGERAIEKYCDKYFILRTSWLYSEHNSNFMKTVIKLSGLDKDLRFIDDQIGTPTYAKDLAELVLSIIESQNSKFGLYHFSNEGVASWYDFAHAILNEINSNKTVLPIKTKDYHTPAKRPYFSVLDKTKIKETFGVRINHWSTSLKVAVSNFLELNTK